MKGLGLSRTLRPSTPKEQLINAVRRLPKNTTIAEALDLAYFLRQINEALTEFEEGRLVPEEEVRKTLLERYA
jgi:predicted transcriptional regulator